MKVIGVDPGRHTGIALSVDGKLTEVFETDFWGAIQHIDSYPYAAVVVELPVSKHVWHNGAVNKAAIQRTGVNVGSCIREAELLIAYLSNDKDRQFIVQKPAGKMNSAAFKVLTGWEKQTNQHMRDAGVMAHTYRHLSPLE